MTDDPDVIGDRLQRTQIDEFFAQELSRAGYGGMELTKTPMGTQIVLKAEKPGMVIGKGGKNIRKLTTQIEEKFDLEDPQIDVQEVDEPDLNAQIVADRLANALERGWYFRKAGHTTIDRIMDSGALGAEIVLSGKVTGARSRVEQFRRGYIKHNGEPADEIVDRGDSTAVMKLGTIGVQVRIIPPNAKLPDDFHVKEDADVEAFVKGVEEVEQAVDDLFEVAKDVEQRSDDLLSLDEIEESLDENEESSESDGDKVGEDDSVDTNTKNISKPTNRKISSFVLRYYADYFAQLYALGECSQNNTVPTDSDLKQLQPEGRDIQRDHAAVRIAVKNGELPEDLAEIFAKELAKLKIDDVSEEVNMENIDEEGVTESLKQMIMTPV